MVLVLVFLMVLMGCSGTPEPLDPVELAANSWRDRERGWGAVMDATGDREVEEFLFPSDTTSYRIMLVCENDSVRVVGISSWAPAGTTERLISTRTVKLERK